MRLGLTAASTLWAASSVLPVLPASGETPRISLRPRKALAFFHKAETASIAEFLGRLRPAPLSPALRAQVMASLPAEGELRATDAERAKLAALEPVFDFHGRKGVLEVKVIDVGHAFVGLHARTVLLVSRDALALVTPQELQALAAHELGHEYVWDEYWTAMTTQTHADAGARAGVRWNRGNDPAGPRSAAGTPRRRDHEGCRGLSSTPCSSVVGPRGKRLGCVAWRPGFRASTFTVSEEGS